MRQAGKRGYGSAQIFFLGAEFTRHYALWFGSLQHERLHFEEMARRTAQPDSE